MAPKGIHSGGYSAVTVQKMAAVPLPPKLKCEVCAKIKNVAQFSKKQLSDYRYKALAVGKNYNKDGGGVTVKCRACTGQQVNELQCCICSEVKELEEFTKVQRRDPDNARCINCVIGVMTYEPGLEEVENEGEEEENSYTGGFSSHNPYDSDNDDDSDGGAPLSGLNSLNLAQHDSMVEASENCKPSYGLPSVSKGGSISAPATRPVTESAWMTSSNTGSVNNDTGPRVWGDQVGKGKNKATSPFTAYDPSGLAHTQFRAPSTNNGGEKAYGRPHAPSGRPFPVASNARDRFPKPSKTNSPLGIMQNPNAGLTGGYSIPKHNDDDDDDDDDDFGYI